MAGGATRPKPRHRCLACGHYRIRGTLIRQAFLCQQCEERLLVTGVSDPGYDDFIVRMRKVWPEFQTGPQPSV